MSNQTIYNLIGIATLNHSAGKISPEAFGTFAVVHLVSSAVKCYGRYIRHSHLHEPPKPFYAYIIEEITNPRVIGFSLGTTAILYTIHSCIYSSIHR